MNNPVNTLKKIEELRKLAARVERQAIMSGMNASPYSKDPHAAMRHLMNKASEYEKEAKRLEKLLDS